MNILKKIILMLPSGHGSATRENLVISPKEAQSNFTQQLESNLYSIVLYYTV